MVDRVPASIIIGGTLSVPLYWSLCERIQAEALAIEWDGDLFEPHHRTLGQPLNLFAYEVAHGRFDELEPFLVEHGLPYARWSGASPGQWGAQRTVFTGTGEAVDYPCDEDDYVMLGRYKAQVLGSIEAIEAYFNAADWSIPPLVVTGEGGDV